MFVANERSGSDDVTDTLDDTPALDDLVTRIDGLSTGADLAAVLVHLERLSRRVEAATVSILARAEATQSFRDDGHGTTVGWARSVVNWSGSEAAARASTAHAVADHPSLMAHLRAATRCAPSTTDGRRAATEPV